MKRKLQLLGLFAVLMLTALSQLSAQVITMTTTKKVGETIGLAIVGEGDITIDGVKEEWQPSTSTIGKYSPDFKRYIITSPTIEIRGKVTELGMWLQGITHLDVSQNPYLVKLDCDENELEELDVSHNSNLEYLDCAKNNLSKLDVSKNKKLRKLSCYKNDITYLDVSQNPYLVKLSCYENELEELDVSHNPNLEYLNCAENELKQLDVSKNKKLETLCCYFNNFSYSAIDNLISGLNDTNISSGNKEFYPLYSSSHKENLMPKHLTEAKAKGWKVYYEYRENFYEKKEIQIEDLKKDDGNVITMTTTKRVGEEIVLTIGGKGFITIDGVKEVFQPSSNMNDENRYTLTSQTIKIRGKVTKLDCSDNKLSHFNISKNIGLTYLDCSDNQLSSLDVSKNTALTTLKCSDNQLSSLGIPENWKLKTLDCSSNQLISLDISKNTGVTELDCSDNQLISLYISKDMALRTLDCSSNQLSSLDVSGNWNLRTLDCSSNQLSSLDVSNSWGLTTLVCDGNELRSLNVSRTALKFLSVENFPVLTSLNCSRMQLRSLDVSKNTALEVLYCYNNLLTELKGCISKKLRRVECYNNRLNATKMWRLINDLNDEGGVKDLVVLEDKEGNGEANQLTKKQIYKAKSKGWRLAYESGGGRVEANADEVPEPTAIEGLDGAEALVCYPNPAMDFVSLKGLEPNSEVEVYSMAGTCVLRGKADASGALNLDVRQLAEGLYIVKTASRTMKLEVKH